MLPIDLKEAQSASPKQAFILLKMLERKYWKLYDRHSSCTLIDEVLVHLKNYYTDPSFLFGSETGKELYEYEFTETDTFDCRRLLQYIVMASNFSRLETFVKRYTCTLVLPCDAIALANRWRSI